MNRKSSGVVVWLAVAALIGGGAPAVRAHGYLVATSYPSLQAAVDAVPTNGGKLMIPAGTYTLTNTLDLTHRAFLEIVGTPATILRFELAAPGPGVDLTGAHHGLFSNLRLEAAGDTCQAGILLARDASGAPAGSHAFSQVSVAGRFTTAGIYNLASEGNRFFSCRFCTSNTAAGSDGFVFTSTNFAGLSSPYAGALAATGRCSSLLLEGCTLTDAGQARAALQVFGEAKNLDVLDCTLDAKGEAVVQLGPDDGTAGRVVLTGCRTSGASAATHFLKAAGVTSQVVIRDSLLECAAGPVIESTGPGRAFNWCLENNLLKAVSGTNGVSFATVTDSTLDVRGCELTGGGTPQPVRVSVKSQNNDFYVRQPSDLNYVTGCVTNADRLH